jgi:hypothetical protein
MMIHIWLIIIGLAAFGLVSGDDAAVFAALIMAAVGVVTEKIFK